MIFKVFIDKEHEEEVLIYAHKETPLVTAIQQLTEEDAFILVGSNDRETVQLRPADVHCFITENNKVYALTATEKLQLKYRLYQVEAQLSEQFVKINQSCIANIRAIQRFDATISGALRVRFKNGYSDFVSRRNLKNVKERLGF
ncbi:MAG: LytTR family transcriptional regulator DNA-binding domain-containing protein [Clostridia bacterium]|nr:LytTR family transcriptional regulator DNA-binding domain-containing protein [Clostridia bacterium]